MHMPHVQCKSFLLSYLGCPAKFILQEPESPQYANGATIKAKMRPVMEIVSIPHNSPPTDNPADTLPYVFP